MSDPFYLRLESTAASITPEAAIHILQQHSSRLGVCVRSVINGVDLLVIPNRGVKDAVERFVQAQMMGRGFA
jgi:hypothetical protein